MTSIDELRLSDFLRHILDAIERCQRYVTDMDRHRSMQHGLEAVGCEDALGPTQ